MKKIYFLFFSLVFANIISAQNTLFKDGKESPKATLEQVNWLTGNWTSNSINYSEENWGKVSGNTIMFCYKMVKNEKIVFYELGHIESINGTLVLKIEHFDKDLKHIAGMQSEFQLLKIEGNRIYFDRITYERISKNKMNVYVYEDDAKTELKFEFVKTKK